MPSTLWGVGVSPVHHCLYQASCCVGLPPCHRSAGITDALLHVFYMGSEDTNLSLHFHKHLIHSITTPGPSLNISRKSHFLWYSSNSLCCYSTLLKGCILFSWCLTFAMSIFFESNSDYSQTYCPFSIRFFTISLGDLLILLLHQNFLSGDLLFLISSAFLLGKLLLLSTPISVHAIIL